MNFRKTEFQKTDSEKVNRKVQEELQAEAAEAEICKRFERP